MEYVTSYLVSTAGVVGLLVLFSMKLPCRPLAGSLITSIAGGTLLAVGSPLIGEIGLLLFCVINNCSGVVLSFSFSLHEYYSSILFFGAPAAVLGVFAGLMAYIGTFFWRDAQRSCFRTMLGWLLLLLAWLALGLGFTAFVLFIGAVIR